MLCFWLPLVACMMIYPNYDLQENLCMSIECVEEHRTEREKFLDYIEDVKIQWYKLWAYWQDGKYDCTGIIYSYFANKATVRKPSTRNFYWYWLTANRFISIDEVEQWDLLLMLKKPWGRRSNHTAVITSVVDRYHVEVIDSFTYKTRMSKRVIPLDTKDHKIYLVKNPFLIGEEHYIPYSPETIEKLWSEFYWSVL